MKDYKAGSHTLWDCKYHIVWVTKYRYARCCHVNSGGSQ